MTTADLITTARKLLDKYQTTSHTRPYDLERNWRQAAEFAVNSLARFCDELEKAEAEIKSWKKAVNSNAGCWEECNAENARLTRALDVAKAALADTPEMIIGDHVQLAVNELNRQEYHEGDTVKRNIIKQAINGVLASKQHALAQIREIEKGTKNE